MSKNEKYKKPRRNSFDPVPCVIAIDQSYKRTGIAICSKGKVVKALSLDFKGFNSKPQRRKEIRIVLRKLIKTCLKKYNNEEIVILVERTRTYTQGNIFNDKVISSFYTIIGTIVDTAYEYGIRTYSVDTRSWKSKVLGTSKPCVIPFEGVKDPQKILSVKKAISLGFEEQLKIIKGNGEFRYYNDDMADAICMSLYCFCKPPYYLNLEE